MPTILTNDCLISCFEGLGSGIIPTANFTPVTGFSLANVGNSQLFSRTRTPDLTADRTLTFDMGVAVEMNTFILAGTNATRFVLGQLQAADNSAFSVGLVNVHSSLISVVDVSLGQSRASYVPPWGRLIVVVLSSSITKRYYRWHQSDITNPYGYQEWAMMRLGLSVQFGFDSWRVNPKHNGPIGSQKTKRGHDIVYNNLTREEAYSLESLLYTMLENRRMLVIPEPLRPETYVNDALWCTFEGAHSREAISTTTNDDKRFRVTASFREAER